MGLCKNCKNWYPYAKEGSDYEKLNYPNHGSCGCNKMNHQDVIRKPFGKDTLLFQDYEGFSIGFITGSHFGCVHFKRRKR